jgi:hypothetical protein
MTIVLHPESARDRGDLEDGQQNFDDFHVVSPESSAVIWRVSRHTWEIGAIGGAAPKSQYDD